MEDENSIYSKEVRCREDRDKGKSRVRCLMKNPKTPGYAKQLVMSDLVYIHEKDCQIFSEKNIIDFYKQVIFNYTFLNDDRFRKAVIFAGKRNIKDMNGKTVLQAYAQYGQDNTLLARIVSNKIGRDISQDKKIVKNYRSYVSHSQKIKGIWGKLFASSKLWLHSIKNAANKVKNIFDIKPFHGWHTKTYDAQKEGLDFLIAAKKAGNKKAFRDFFKIIRLKEDLTRTPGIAGRKKAHKVVDNIMEFAGANFRNELCHKK